MRISDWSSDVCSSDLCLRAARASEAFARRQVAPRPDGQPGQRNPADADAADRHRVQADLRAHVAQLPALHALEREAQADLVLPADLSRRQRAAAVMQSVVELAQSVGRDLAAHFHFVLLFDLVPVLGPSPPPSALLVPPPPSFSLCIYSP